MSRFYRILVVFYLCVAFARSGFAVLPVNEDVEFSGGGTNNTFSADWLGRLVLKIDVNGGVTGFIDADGLPNGRTICGSGNLEGTKSGAEIIFSYTSTDPDPGCGFDQGVSRTYTGRLTDDETRFSGTYQISNGQQGVFAFTAEGSEDPWIDLKPLDDNYQSLKAEGSNEVAFANEFSCLASTSCAEFEANGSNGWADGFVKHLFESMETADGLTSALGTDCLDFISNYACFLQKGIVHSVELVRGFSSYCSNEFDQDDYKQWDQEHRLFLKNAVLPCFRRVQGAGELPFSGITELTIEGIIGGADILREGSQIYCQALGFATEFIDGRTSAGVMSARNNNPEAASNALYDSILANEGTLEVTSLNRDFLVNVGSEFELSVQRRNSDGTVDDLTRSPDNQYYVTTAADSVTVDNGLVTVDKYANPSAVINRSNLLYIVVRNGDDYGIAQFAIVDSDRDEDGLVDSYEVEHGLNRFFENEPDKDSDRDALTDQFEAAYGTHPREKDSDEDGYSDGFEYYLDSDPLDPDCNPIDVCPSVAPDTPVEEQEPVDEETPVAGNSADETTEPESEPSPDNPFETEDSSTTQNDESDDIVNSSSGSGGGAVLWQVLGLLIVVLCRRHLKLVNLRIRPDPS